MSQPKPIVMDRTKIRKILLRHRGSSSRVARKLNVSRVSVSDWLHGRVTSARIAAAATFEAKKLIGEM